MNISLADGVEWVFYDIPDERSQKWCSMLDYFTGSQTEICVL